MSATIVRSRLLEAFAQRVGLRWIVLSLIVLAASINYIDRQVLSVLAPLLRQEFGWTNTAYSTLVFVFLLGWALGKVPIGIYVDRVGPRIAYNLIVFTWSAVIGLHSCARSLSHFLGLRFLLGFGECGNFSGGMKVISQWFPVQERGRAAGYFNGAINIGAIIAPPLTVWLALHFGWRAAFLLPAVLGFLWVILWMALYRAPHEHPWASQKELDYIESRRDTPLASESTPERESSIGFTGLLRHRESWGLMISRFLIGPVWSLYVFWLPEYLKRERQMSMVMIGLVAWIPWVMSLLGNISGGEFSSFLIRRQHGVLFPGARPRHRSDSVRDRTLGRLNPKHHVFFHIDLCRRIWDEFLVGQLFRIDIGHFPGGTRS